MKKIALLDDNHMILKSIKNILVKADYCVYSTDNTREFFQMIQENEFDLFIVDHQLKECTSVDFIPVLRKFPNYIDTPVIILSGVLNVEVIQSLIPYGIKDILVKPLKIDILLEKINKLL